jgi:hypothetical protein
VSRYDQEVSATSADARPRLGLSVSDCVFYHSVDLPRSGRQEGAWDLTGRFDDYIGHQDLAGRTLLDVGAATGFLSFEAERRGAVVTSFDVRSAELWHELPLPGSRYVEDYDSWLADWEQTLEGIRNSYWLCHDEFGSSARCIYGDVYELNGERHDVVLLGQILVHLRDGLSAVAAAARVCGETLIVVEGNFEGEYPVAGLCGRAPGDSNLAWYQYSHGWYREVLTMLGFRAIEITTDVYRCNDPLFPREVELATVVASR